MKARSIFITFILVCIVLSLFVGISGAAWCNGDFAKRINVSVNNTGGSALTDYQVYVNLTSNPINETSMRVYNTTGCTLRPHWTENETGGNSYEIWINYSSIAASTWTNNTAIYYDNANVDSVNNITNTFLFGDSFTAAIFDTEQTEKNYFVNDIARYGASDSIVAYQSIHHGDRVYFGLHGNNLDPYAMSYNITTGNWSDKVYVGDNPLGDDGHGTPSILRDSNGYLHIFYGSHGSAQKYAKSTNPDNISAWTAMSDPFTGTYPVPRLTSNGDIYVFYRTHPNGHYAYKNSSNGGSSWGSETVIITAPANDCIYTGYVEHETGTPEKMHIGWMHYDYDYDPDSTLRHRDVFYAYLNLSDWHMYNVSGTDLGTDISDTEAENSCKVFAGNPCHNIKVHIDSSGIPYIIFNHNGTFNYTKWSGSSWTSAQIITTTVTTPYASAWQNSEDFIVHSSTNIEGYFDTGNTIERWDYNGATWSRNSFIANGSDYDDNLCMPAITYNYTDDFKLVFSQCGYGNDKKAFAYGNSGFVNNTFESGTSDKWQTTNTSLYTVSGGNLILNYLLTAPEFTQCLNSKFNFNNYITEARVKAIGTTDGEIHVEMATSVATIEKKEETSVRLGDTFVGYIGGVHSTGGSGVSDTWYRSKISVPSSGTAGSYIYSDDLNTLHVSKTGTPTYTTAYIALIQTANGTGYVDWIFVRKYASPEPSSTLGSEEEQPEGTTPVISNVVNGSISSTSQYIDWDVNQTAHNRVLYSNESDLTPAYYSSWDNSTNAPNVTLSGLESSTQYWYQVWSYNTTNTSLSDNSSTLSFTTSYGVPVITLLSQYPSLLYQNSTGYFNVTYMISHNSTGLNNSSVSFVYTNYDTDNTNHNWSLRVPANNRSEICTDMNGEKILRADNRNNSLNFENNATITGGNVYEWGGSDENTTRMTIVPVNSTHTLVHWNGTITNTVSMSMWYLDRVDQENASMTTYDIYKNHRICYDIWDIEAIGGHTNYLLSAYLDTHLSSGTPNKPNLVYYCNDSFDPEAAINPEDSVNCFYVTSHNATSWIDYKYNARNSTYIELFTVNQSMINASVLTTKKAHICFNTEEASSKPYSINITNSASITNRTFGETNTTRVGGDAPLAENYYTTNAFMSYSHVAHQHQMKLFVADNNSLWGNSSLKTTDIGFAYYPPTTPAIDYFNFQSTKDYDMNATYNGTFDINVLVGTDPDSGDTLHNLTLHYGNQTFVAVINDSFYDVNATNGDINISFDSSSYYSVIDNYTLKIVATDDESKTSQSWLGVNFSLQSATPTLHIGNIINIKEDWGRDFDSNLSANVTVANASSVWMNFTNAEFTNTSLGWLNLTLDEWVNESHNVNALVANISVDVYLNSTTSGATNDTDSFWYEVTNRTNTATMDSAGIQNVATSETFYVNATCNEEYGDTFYGAANLLEDGAIIDTNSSVTNYVNFSHSESSAGQYNYTIRYYNLTHYDNATTPTYSNVTVSDAEYIPPDPTNLQNTTGYYWVNYTWDAGSGNVTDLYNVSWNNTWYNDTVNNYMNDTIPPNGWANITVYAFNSSGIGTLSVGSVSDEVKVWELTYIPNDPVNIGKFIGNFWVNHTWDVTTYVNGQEGKTDSHNVSVNQTWYNGSFILHYNNTPLSAHVWSNITVWAYNNSGNGNLSNGNVSEDVQISNNVPVLSGLPDNTTDEDVNQTDIFDLDNYFTDIDGDTPTYLVESNNQSTNVTVTINASNNVSYSLASGWNGTALVVINVTDGWGGEDNDTFLIFVNAPPGPGDYIPATPTTLANTTGNGWVNYTWSSGGGANITDSYNVSWNLTWYNTTLVSYMNKSVGEFGWANISVWAFNSSGNGSLSAGNVSDNTQAGGGTYTTSMTTTVYNLISYYGSATSTAEQFGIDIGSVDYIAMYNGSFYSHTMGFVANNFTTYHGIGYYVFLNVSGSSTYQRNNISDSPYNTQLFNRWNTIGWTNATDTNAEGVAASIGSACKYTSSLNADGITYTTHTVGFTSNNHAVEKGEGYWVWVNTGGAWSRNS